MLRWIALVSSLAAGLSACAGATSAPGQSTAAVPAEETAQPPATQETDLVSETATQPAAAEVDQAMAFRLNSTAFEQGKAIPKQYTCDGDDISPALSWSDPPQGTQSFALIADDPDAPGGTWVHWVLFNIPADARGLVEAIRPDPKLADGSVHGTSSFRSLGYGGPCPPGGTHRYFFKLYALAAVLDLQPGVNKAAVEAAMKGRVLTQTELMGTYSR